MPNALTAPFSTPCVRARSVTLTQWNSITVCPMGAGPPRCVNLCPVGASRPPQPWTPVSSARVDSSTSFSRISASPTRNASMPIPARRRQSACREMPLSATTILSAGMSGFSRSQTSSEVSKVLRSRLLTPISRPSSASARWSSTLVVDLDQHVQAEVVRGLVERARGLVVDRRHDDEDAIGAPGARLQHLIGIEEEILAQDRQRRRRARLDQMLRVALERRRVGEHRQAGRAARLIAAGEPRRLEILADQALRRTRLLDLGDERRTVPPRSSARAP